MQANVQLATAREGTAVIDITCPNCQEILSVPEKYIGTKGKCRKCGGAVVVEAPAQPAAKEAPVSNGTYGDYHNPNLMILHLEATGPSSRKCNIIELGCIKIDRFGREIDTYWTFCNPDQQIPQKIRERTGISDEMVAQAPYAYDVVREFFQWAGPNPVLISDHAHFHAKFLAAPMFREDVVPPECRIIDVVDWAKELRLPTSEYRLRPLLESIGSPMEKEQRRALDTCNAMRNLAEILIQKEQQACSDGDTTLFGKILGKGGDEALAKHYKAVLGRSQSLVRAWGDLYEFNAFEARRKGIPLEKLHNESSSEADGMVLHLPEWFDEKKKHLKKLRGQPTMDSGFNEDHSGDAAWEFALIEASQSDSPEEKRQFLMKAIDLRATDPKPYEHLLGFFIKEKKYEKAHDVCESYFESESWKLPQYASTSLKILDKLQKLEHKLAKHY